MEDKKELYDFYDKIVNSIYLNVCAERNKADDDIILWDFQSTNPVDRLYFNVATAASDIYECRIYLDMPFFKFWKFCREHKGRKNICWISPRLKKALPNEVKTSVYIIMEYVRDYFNISMDTFKEINEAYYEQRD